MIFSEVVFCLKDLYVCVRLNAEEGGFFTLCSPEIFLLKISPPAFSVAVVAEVIPSKKTAGDKRIKKHSSCI